MLFLNGWNPVAFDVVNVNVGNAWNKANYEVNITTAGIYYVHIDMTACYSNEGILNLNVNSVATLQVCN